MPRFTDEDEAYVAGKREAYIDVARTCADKLGSGQAEIYYALDERMRVAAALRRVCEKIGDNDWPDDLDLGDVIEKHLEGYL